MKDFMEKRVPPILSVTGESLPEAWENSYVAIGKEGMTYKRKDDRDPEDQIDCSMIMEVRNPDADPFSHKLGGTNAVMHPLLDYYYEIMGSKDSWIKDFGDPTDTRWDYLYHERLAKHPAGSIDQIEFAIKRLIKNPSSRRTNMITWHPERDTIYQDTPCLQRIWFNIVPGQEERQNDVLDMRYHFRSRNVVSASFGNMQGLYMLGCHIRDKVEIATGRSLDMRMVDQCDSFHVNSKDLDQFKANYSRIDQSEPLEKRTYNRDFIVEMLVGCREKVEEDIFKQTEKRLKTKFKTGDFEAEKIRVRGIGDRIFYLLDKYAPKN